MSPECIAKIFLAQNRGLTAIGDQHKWFFRRPHSFVFKDMCI